MLTPEKRKEFEARLGPAAVASILGEVEQTEKSADGLGVRHKGEDQPERTARWDGTQWVETTKADAMPPELDAKAEGDGGEMAMEDELIEAEPLDDAPAGEFVGDMTPDEFMGMLTTAMQATFAPLIEALNIESKMRGVVEEVKGIASGYQTTKDAAAAEAADLAQQIATLKAEQAATAAKLKELEGDQPASATAGYRASLHGPPPTIPALKDAAPQIDPELRAFFSFGGQ